MKLWKLAMVLQFVGSLGCIANSANDNVMDVDIVIYGGTSSGVMAAVQVAKMGRSVVVVSPSKHVGRLSAGGLGFTDIGHRAAIGGLSREFYERIYRYSFRRR